MFLPGLKWYSFIRMRNKIHLHFTNFSLLIIFNHLDGTTANERAWEEIRIEVPWGYVAGKWYGNRSQQPVIGRY